MSQEEPSDPQAIPDVELDVPHPLIECINSCMVHCVVGCCGVDAFDCSPVQIRKWARKNPVEDVRAAARQADELIGKISDQRYRFRSLQLNHYTCDEGARKRLVDFIGCFDSVLKERLAARPGSTPNH